MPAVLQTAVLLLAWAFCQVRAVQFNASELYLSDHDFEITAVTRTRHYNFLIKFVISMILCLQHT